MEPVNQKLKKHLLEWVNKPFTRILLALLLTATIFESCKKNGVESDDEFLLASTSKTIETSGGNINLPQVATVYFDANTFDSPIECKLYNSNNPETQEDLSLAEALYGMTDRFDQEIRINVGKSVPNKAIKVEINLTNEFISKVSGDLGIRAYAKLFVDDVESTENFESLATKFYASRKVLEIELEPEYFSNIWTKDGSYEAIISVGITPGINPSAGRKKEDCSGGVYISCPVRNGCTVTSQFSPTRIHPVTKKVTGHKGADLRAAVDTEILAASDGVIKLTGYQFNKARGTGWGNFVFIEHINSEGQRFATLYAHLNSVSVKTGNRVTEGQLIAKSGQTGGVKGPHLHFEYVTNTNINDKEARVDPIPYINSDLPRLNSAVGSVLGVNSCSGGTRTSWKVVFNFKDPSNSINQGGQLIFQDVEPVVNPPYSVPVNLLSANNGAVATDVFCAHWGDLSYFKIKVFIRLANGKESNCIYFNLARPAGANRIATTNTHPSSFEFK